MYSGIYWNDSPCSLKAVLLTGPVVRFLMAEQLLTDAMASKILMAVLQGLQNHGQHDSNQVSCWVTQFSLKFQLTFFLFAIGNRQR